MKKWFIQILQGTKLEEYRDIKPYWTTRLYNQDKTPKQYDIIIFKNGYQKNAPTMKVEFKGIKEGIWNDKKVYAIQLGKILETKDFEKLIK